MQYRYETRGGHTYVKPLFTTSGSRGRFRNRLKPYFPKQSSWNWSRTSSTSQHCILELLIERQSSFFINPTSDTLIAMHFTTTFLASCLAMGVSVVSGQYGDVYSSPASMPAASGPTPSVAPASAASSSATSAVSSTLPSEAASAGSIHVVKVGNAEGKLVYEPADIKAAVGDMVQYHFYPKVRIETSTLDRR